MKRRYAVAALVAAGAFVVACADGPTSVVGQKQGTPTVRANTPITGASFTTTNPDVDRPGGVDGGTPTLCLNGTDPQAGANNCNIYGDKSYVWLNGGSSTAYVGNGTYFFAVLAPGGQPDPKDGSAKNLSDDYDTYTDRTFTVTDGVVSYSGPHDVSGNRIRLAQYADSPNSGGVYIMAICSLADGYANVNANDCKYDAFKIGGTAFHQANALTATKDANGAYTNTYGWTIAKAVDKTKVTALNGNATFNYTVTVTHNAGTISGIGVSGTIAVFNPNVDASSNTLPVVIDGITDQLSNGTTCAVTGGGAQTLTQAQTNFAYNCTISGTTVPSSLNNTVTVSWSEQVLDDGSLLDAGSANFQFTGISFTANTVDETIDVTDSFAGTLGTVSVGDANPKTFSYSRTVPIPTSGCTTYNNTATFTTTDTHTTGTASQSVQACRVPPTTGALTMGFWQNKNGQGIISGSCGGVSGTTLRTFLTAYNPFKDLTATNCAGIATYVYNIIKAANSSGSSMNPMLKAQMLATALDVYFSDPTLGGNRIGAYNGRGNSQTPVGTYLIDLTMVCKMIDGSGGGTCSGTYQNVGLAFGGASSMTVSNMLAYTAGQSNLGGSSWYGQVKTTQEMAKNAFDAINNQVAFAAAP